MSRAGEISKAFAKNRDGYTPREEQFIEASKQPKPRQALLNTLTGGAADTSYLRDYKTLAKNQSQWTDLDMYANGGSSKAQLRSIIDGWETSGKISADDADEMYYAYNLGEQRDHNFAAAGQRARALLEQDWQDALQKAQTQEKQLLSAAQSTSYMDEQSRKQLKSDYERYRGTLGTLDPSGTYTGDAGREMGNLVKDATDFYAQFTDQNDYNERYIYPTKYAGIKRGDVNTELLKLKNTPGAQAEYDWLSAHQYDYWTADELDRAITHAEVARKNLQQQRNSMPPMPAGSRDTDYWRRQQEALALTRQIEEQDSLITTLRNAKASNAYRDEYAKWDAQTQADFNSYGEWAESLNQADSTHGVSANPLKQEEYAQARAGMRRFHDALDALGYTDEEREAILDRAKKQYNLEQRIADAENWAELADQGFWGKASASVASVGMNLLSGLSYLDLAAQGLTRGEDPFTGDKSTIDYNTGLARISSSSDAARAAVSADMGSVGSFLYNTGMSIADFAAAALLGKGAGFTGAAEVLLSGSAAAKATDAAYLRGASDAQALSVGFLAGAAEALFEHVSLDKLKAFQVSATGARQTVGQFMKNLGKQAFVEGSEEVATTLANTLTDAIIMADKSEINTAIRHYMAQNMSEEEATRQAWKDWLDGLAQDFAGGMLSGGVMGSGAYALGRAQAARGARAAGKQIQSAESRSDTQAKNVQLLVDYALRNGTDARAAGTTGAAQQARQPVVSEAGQAQQNAATTGDAQYSSRDYSYEALVRKPDMELTTVTDVKNTNRADVVYYALKNTASVGYTNENGNAVVHVDDIDTDIVVSKRSIVHGLDRRLNAQAPVLMQIGSVLKNAICINELLPKSDYASNTYILIGAARSDTGLYITSFVVNRFSNEVTGVNVLYSANAKKESAALLPKITDKSATPTDSTISIRELLDYVNKYFPDILPESALRHYGYAARPEGKLGESALYQERGDGHNDRVTPAEDSGAQYSIREFEDGRKFVDIETDQEQFDGLSVEEQQSLARNIILKKFAQRVIGEENRVFVNRNSAKEYAYPAKFIKDNQLKSAKMRASTELDNLIAVGTNFRTEPDGRDGHVHSSATGDFQYFDTLFKVGNDYYTGVVNIMQNQRGLLLKDVTKIRNVTKDINSSYGTNPKSAFLRDASMNSIRNRGENSNPKPAKIRYDGGVVDGVAYAPVNMEHLTQQQWAAIQAVEKLSEVTGIQFVFYESQANAAGRYTGANGIYRNNTIYLDVNAGKTGVGIGETAILRTASHELTHYIQQFSPEQYAGLKTFVGQHLLEAGQSLEVLARQKMETSTVALNDEQAMDEVVADACEMMLRSSTAVQTLARENRSLFDTIRAWLSDFAAKLRQAFAGVHAVHAEAQAMLQYADELQKLWDDALVGAVRSSAAASGQTGYSGRAKAEESPLETWVRQHPPIDGTQLLIDYMLRHSADTPAQRATGEPQYSIRYDAENTPFVVVEQDILQGVPQNEWVKTVKNNLREKFPNGVHVGNNLVVINNQSRREMTFSNYMQRIIKTEPNLYKDKLRAAYYADEILQASRNYVNEALLHPRKDAMIDFARGEVLLRIGTKDYKAQVIVGNRGSGNLLLYDIINLVPTEIQERIKKAGTGRYTTKSPTETGSSQPVPAANSIRNRGEKSNPHPAEIRIDGGVAAARNVPASQGATGNDSRAKAEESPLETWVRQHPPVDGTQLLKDYVLRHSTDTPAQRTAGEASHSPAAPSLPARGQDSGTVDGTQLLKDYVLRHSADTPAQRAAGKASHLPSAPSLPTRGQDSGTVDGTQLLIDYMLRNGGDAGISHLIEAAEERAEVADARDSEVTTLSERGILDAKDQPAADVEQDGEVFEHSFKTIDTGALKVVEFRTPEIANREWLDRNYNIPPYDPEFEVKIVQAGNEEYVRVFSYKANGASNKFGGWLMRKRDIEGLTPSQIADKYALPKVPTHICDVKVSPDIYLQTGIANAVDGWGSGGGQQFDTMGEMLPHFIFINERQIGE